MRLPTLTPINSRNLLAGSNNLFGGPDYGRRITRPDYYNGFFGGAGGLGVVPRRGWDERTSDFIASVGDDPVRSVRTWAAAAPLVVLEALCATHPLAQMAMSNDLALAFGPDDITFVATQKVTKSDGTVSEENDSDGTAALSALFESLPADTGGQMGLCWTLAQQASEAGMGCVEAVPGDSGLADIATYSPLSVRFRDTDAGRVAEQRQRMEWTLLDPLRCLSVPWRGSRDNPYGMPRYGAFLAEGLADISEQKDFRDWLHSVAWPRLSAAFPYNEVVQYARDNPEVLVGAGPDGEDLTESEYAARQFALFAERIETMKADDTFLLPMGAELKAVVASAAGLEHPLVMRRLRVIQSLDQLPNLVGVTDGGTQAYATEQFRAYAQKLEALRKWVISILIKVLNLHLRLMGLPLTAKAVTKPILPADRLKEAQARALEIANSFRLVDRGYITDEDAANTLTGSGVADPARAQAAYDRAMSGATQTDPTAPGQPADGKGTNP